MPSVGAISATLTSVSKTAAYTAATGELVLANASGAAYTVTLPATPTSAAVVAVKKTDSSANAVTVAGQGATTIDGDATCALTAPGAAATFSYDTAAAMWRITDTANVNVGADSLQGLYVPTYTPGRWYDRRAANGNQGQITAVAPGTSAASPNVPSQVTYVPQYSHRAITIDMVGISTGSTPTPTAGHTIRLGLYANTINNTPGARLYDWGTVSPTATSTPYTLAAAGVIPKGWSWWAVCANATAGGSLIALNAVQDHPVPVLGWSVLNMTNMNGYPGPRFYYEAGVALPATATPIEPVQGVYNVTDVFFRVL